MDTIAVNQIHKLMKKGISDNVFPGGVLLVAVSGCIKFFKSYGYADIFSKQKMTTDTRFDLASLTKPLATTLAVMKLVQEGRLNLDDKLGVLIKEFGATDKKDISIRQLLHHNSGLPDYIPYYKETGMDSYKEDQKILRKLLLKTSLHSPIGKIELYSDVGFMILNWVVERISGISLNQYVEKHIYDPMGIDTKKGLFFVDLNSVDPVKKKKRCFAATEYCPLRKVVLNGVVHDENAYAAGGVEGHAGLFGNAESVYAVLSALMDGYHTVEKEIIFPKRMLTLFLKCEKNNKRPLGFDSPSPANSSAGQYFSKESVGHLGFTGTSFWMDLERKIIVILLTNRIHPSRENLKIRDFRPILHDVVMENMVKAKGAFR